MTLFITLALTLVAVFLFGGFVWGAASNARDFWLLEVRGDKSRFLIPLISGAMGAVALAIFPFYPLTSWRALPLLLDCGCLPILLVAGAREARCSWREWQLTHPRQGVVTLSRKELCNFQMEARLHENGQVRLQLLNTDPRPYWKTSRHWMKVTHSGIWKAENGRLTFEVGTLVIEYLRVPSGVWVWASSNRANDFDGIDLEIEKRRGRPFLRGRVGLMLGVFRVCGEARVVREADAEAGERG